MKKCKGFLMYLLILILMLAAIPASAASGTTVWAINDAAQLVSASYEGTDWIGRMSFGQSFELLETRGDSVKLRNLNGKIGWTARENIAYYDPCDLHQVMYVQADGDILWPQADFEDEPISLHKGDMVTAIGLTPWKVWYAVLFRNELYYVPSQLLAGKPAPEDGNTYAAEQRYVFGSGVDFYRTPDETIEPFTYIEDGTAVRLLDASELDTSHSVGPMVKVQTADGTTGYIHLSNLIALGFG